MYDSTSTARSALMSYLQNQASTFVLTEYMCSGHTFAFDYGKMKHETNHGVWRGQVAQHKNPHAHIKIHTVSSFMLNIAFTTQYCAEVLIHPSLTSLLPKML